MAKASFALWLLWVSGLAVAEHQYRNTPMERVRLASEIPHNPDAYNFTVTGEIDGVDYHPEAVPLVDVSFGSSMPEVGRIEVGTIIEPEVFRSYRGRFFYRIDLGQLDDTKQGQFGWLDGRFLRLSLKSDE